MCPRGCEITLTLENDVIEKIEGATCAKGEAYVRQEVTDPRRNIATSVLVEGGVMPLASVKLSQPIPKARIMDAMKVIKTLRLTAPVEEGAVAARNILGLGSDVIVTRAVPHQ